MDPELKRLLEEQAKTFEAFKAANDAMAAEQKKLGAADATTADEVKKINAALDAVNDAIKKCGTRADEIEAKANRLALGPTGPAAELEQKHVEAFNLQARLSAQLKGRTPPVAVDVAGFRAYKQAFAKWARGGEAMLEDADRKAMSVGSDPDGGYLVTPDTGGRIVTKVFESSPIRQIAAVQPISTDALEGINDLNEANAGWVAEQGTRPATSTPQVGKWRIPVHEMYAMPEATQQLLDDSMVDIEAWLAGKVADKLARLEATAFVSGDGAGKPRGFLDYTTAATADATRAWGVLEHLATGTSASFGTDPNGADKLIELVHKLKEAYRGGARWVMNRAVLGAVRKLKDTEGGYIWLPSMEARQPSSLLGYPVTEAEDMPAVAANSLSVAFGNFQLGYQIVDRQGIRSLRDPFTNKPFVRFYTTRRVGGDVQHFEAIKLLKFA